jgi:hypothetical protein
MGLIGVMAPVVGVAPVVSGLRDGESSGVGGALPHYARPLGSLKPRGACSIILPCMARPLSIDAVPYDPESLRMPTPNSAIDRKTPHNAVVGPAGLTCG